jgi:type II secretory pathway pseudopilin PulG
MTLVEILIATGILALGMMGILSLLPYAIRNTADSVHNTIGASVAKTAMASLKEYCLDLDEPSDSCLNGNIKNYGSPLVIPDALKEDSPINDFITNYREIPSDNEGEMVIYKVNDKNTNYGWSARVEKNAGNTSQQNVLLDVWHKERSGLSTDMDVQVHDPIYFSTTDENLLVNDTNKKECRIWYKADVEIREGQNIFVDAGFKWNDGDQWEYYLPVEEITDGPSEMGGGIYIRFNTRKEITQFKNSTSHVSVPDKNYFIGQYSFKVDWNN